MPTVTIIGLGPRGLGVLERLVTLAQRDPSAAPLDVNVIDPTCTGAGVHSLDQPDYLQMHCPGTDLTMFPDSASIDGEPERSGPNLFEWADRNRLRVNERPGDPAYRPVAPTDFLPRRVFGEYLSWFLGQLLARTGERVRVWLHRDEAVDAREETGGRIVVRCRSGSEVASEFLFITVGYGQGPQGPATTPFPLPPIAPDIPAGEPIAISGFGLTALDIVSFLTVGRGGSFRTRGGELEYVPSGREPVIHLYSRSGVPARARPHSVGVRQEYEPVVLTTDLVRRLRSRDPGTLDFEADLWPLIEIEMRTAYWRTFAGGTYVSRVKDAVRRGQADLVAVLDALDAEYGSVDMRALFTGEEGMSLADGPAYERWVRDYVAADLREAALYPDGSPAKAALETIEDAFDLIRGIVSYGVFTAEAHTKFMNVDGPRLRRIAVGPIADRQAELLALMRADVIRTPLGPDPVVVGTGPGGVTIRSSRLAAPAEIRVTALLSGQTRTPMLDGSGPPLLTNLHARGMLRPLATLDPATLAVDVDEQLHPRDRDGRPHRRIWLMGPICEGVTFYTHVLPEPGVRSDCVVNAHRAVRDLLDSDVVAGSSA